MGSSSKSKSIERIKSSRCRSPISAKSCKTRSSEKTVGKDRSQEQNLISDKSSSVRVTRSSSREKPEPVRKGVSNAIEKKEIFRRDFSTNSHKKENLKDKSGTFKEKDSKPPEVNQSTSSSTASIRKKDDKVVPNILKRSSPKKSLVDLKDATEVEPDIIEELRNKGVTDEHEKICEPHIIVQNTKEREDHKTYQVQTISCPPQAVTVAPSMAVNEMNVNVLGSETPSVISRSELFVFQNKLPFGIFEEDLMS